MNAFSGPRTKTRAAQAAETREAVLEAARHEFERVGFEQASIRDIAAKAGVSAGTVIHHHGDKRELLHAALFEALDAALRKALAGAGPGPLEEQLGRVTVAVFRHYKRRPKLARTLLRESLFADGPWAKRFAAQAAEVHTALAGFVVAARDRGELRADVDPIRIAVAYLSFFYFGLIGWTQGGLARPEALVDGLVRQHLEGARPIRRARSRRTS